MSGILNLLMQVAFCDMQTIHIQNKIIYLRFSILAMGIWVYVEENLSIKTMEEIYIMDHLMLIYGRLYNNVKKDIVLSYIRQYSTLKKNFKQSASRLNQIVYKNIPTVETQQKYT